MKLLEHLLPKCLPGVDMEPCGTPTQISYAGKCSGLGGEVQKKIQADLFNPRKLSCAIDLPITGH